MYGRVPICSYDNKNYDDCVEYFEHPYVCPDGSISEYGGALLCPEPQNYYECDDGKLTFDRADCDLVDDPDF